MKISTKSRYAVMAMVEMAVSKVDHPVSLSDIANKQQLPLPYLEQLFAKLRRAQLVESTRGAHGGYKLSKSLEKISVIDIILAVDRPIKTTRCKPGPNSGCLREGKRCMTHDLWAELESVITNFLQHVTLLDIKKGKVSGLRFLFTPPEKSNKSISNSSLDSDNKDELTAEINGVQNVSVS